MKGIRVIVGPFANDEFKVYAEDGEDLTDKLHVKSVRVEASADTLTAVHLECYGEVDARGEVHYRSAEDSFVPSRASCRWSPRQEFVDTAKSLIV